jgi:8-oxo-dGTP pyrophosphatase MutT (NUDIX family)
MTTSRFDEERIIRIVAAVVVNREGRTLLVRKRGTAAFMQPGGKLSFGETAVAALAREIREELACEVGGHCRPLGTFRAPAANEAGAVVEAQLFEVSLSGDVSPAAEIEEVLWHDPFGGEGLVLAPLTRDHVLPMLRGERLSRQDAAREQAS